MQKTHISIGISLAAIVGQLIFLGVQYVLKEFGWQDVIMLAMLNGMMAPLVTLISAVALGFALFGAFKFKEKSRYAVAATLLAALSLYVGYSFF